MSQDRKPDLTAPRNLLNYLIYTFAGVISFLYFSSEKKSTVALENCENEKKAAQQINTQLLLSAYKIKNEEIQKKAEQVDSMTAENLKDQTKETIKNIKNFTTKKK